MIAGDHTTTDVFTVRGHGWFAQEVRRDADGLELGRNTIGRFASRAAALDCAAKHEAREE